MSGDRQQSWGWLSCEEVSILLVRLTDVCLNSWSFNLDMSLDTSQALSKESKPSVKWKEKERCTSLQQGKIEHSRRLLSCPWDAPWIQLRGHYQDLQPERHPRVVRWMHDISTRDETHHAWSQREAAYLSLWHWLMLPRHHCGIMPW